MKTKGIAMRNRVLRVAGAVGLLFLATTMPAQPASSPQQGAGSHAISAPAAAPLTNVKVYLIGDSTMSIKETRAYPETGWGMPFAYFFDSSVTVDNRAKNGRSTKTFLSEGLWQSVTQELKEGDYVFIQFGHNDEAKEKTERYTTPEEYKTNLARFVSETRAKKAIPVLLTPVARRKFDASGHIVETHEIYSNLVRSVAKEQNVVLIDLDKKSQALLEQYGETNSKLLFDWLEPGEHPNYPEGKQDNTHFNELGARKIAELVLVEMKALHLDLADKVVKRQVIEPPAAVPATDKKIAGPKTPARD
ncbi:MAG TPA: rhamnogalacturonan acetylesterase [Candidatus Angelobacter sp.]|nr:rhamnogalacturonan acetylesterase [Candidatus Angelobacter sp.]